MGFNITALKLPSLRKGSYNSYVTAWQSFLKDAEFPIGTIDGDFGNLTEVATRTYQQRNNLPVTGVVDNTTYEKALTQGFLFRVPNLSAAMLLDYLRYGMAEVRDLQASLNAIAQLNPPLAIDGDFGPRSAQGLAQTYKQRDVRFRGELEQQLSNATKQKLAADFSPGLDLLNTYAKRQRFRLSGPHWADNFPTSRSISDLVSPFRNNAQAFQDALIAAGAQIIIAATYRPKERAYLMHYSSRIYNRDISPQNVPPMAGVDIDWVHYTNAGSLQAAEQMVEAYGTWGNPVALNSRHTQRLAIDWNITWQSILSIKDGNGRTVKIGNPPNGANNQTLWDVGRSYGVIKLPSDPPHWSSDGF
jgi:hypothetical protein